MVNRENRVLVKRYRADLGEVKQLNPKTVTVRRDQLRYLLERADETPFVKAPSVKPSFPEYVKTHRIAEKPEPPTLDYRKRVCSTARAFLTWLRAE
jgi:hypothetical protein